MYLFFTAPYSEQAHYFENRLKQRGLETNLSEVEQINARFLRKYSDLALCVDQKGLWLCGGGMKMQPDWNAEIRRLKRASLKSELIARACQLGETPHIIDATAGLGHDSLLMAHLGAKVILVERHPILFTLLEDAKNQAEQEGSLLAASIERMDLVFKDSNEYLEECRQKDKSVDVIYLDPMFPQRDHNQQSIKKQAQVKKQMQLLHLLFKANDQVDLGDRLLPLAQKIAKRVVVKRPRHANFLDYQIPDHQWLGEACRFDAYFPLLTD